MSQQQTFGSGGGGGGGAVDSVTANNGLTATPTTGNVVVSGVPATTAAVGVASFNPANFTVDPSGQVSAISVGNVPWTDQGTDFNAVENNGYFCTAPLTLTLPATPAQGDVVSVAIDFATTPGNAVIVQANAGQTIRTANQDSSVAGTATNTAQGDALSLVYRTVSNEWFSLSTEGSWFLV